jgi:RNA polymerase sigma-70 factor (ECF subfamily)
VARNLVLDHLERRRRHPAASGDSAVQEQLRDHPAPPGPESTLIEVEYRRQVFRWAAEAVRRQVTGVTWEAFWRTAVEGQAVRDVAAALGLTPGAVYVARSRVLDRLRRQVALLEDEPSPEADL